MYNGGIVGDNIQFKQEDNYSILSKHTDVWQGDLPFKTGDVFPTAAIKERAMISNTNKLIYENNVDDIYSNIISIFPEIDPIYGMQIREIVTNLPYFKNSVNYWIGLIAGEPPVVDGDESIDIQINEVIENSNWGSIIQDEIRSRFMDVISAYRVDVDIMGNPTIVAIEAKNLICYVSKVHTTSIEVNVIFNIYVGDNGKKYIEFIEYHYNGKIIKTVFEYGDGIIGRRIDDLYEESLAFNGEFEMSPIVVFKHNTVSNQIYGTDQFRYWSPSMLGAMRELQNIFRLGERTREMIRKVPESSVKKNNATGESVFFNKGTISYPDGEANPPAIEYLVPEIRMDEAVKAFEKAMKSVSIDTGLGPVFFDLEKLGTNLSAKSIEAALYPTKLEAKRVTTEMTPFVKELVIKLAAMAGLDISNKSKFRIMWSDGFPQDIKDYTDAIQKRLGDKPSIGLVDAIVKLDKVTNRIARQKAAEIEGDTSDGNLVTVDVVDEGDIVSIDGDGDKLNTHEITPTAGQNVDDTVEIVGDNTLWENQMYPAPRDISFEHSKGVKESWLRRKLKQSLSK